MWAEPENRTGRRWAAEPGRSRAAAPRRAAIVAAAAAACATSLFLLLGASPELWVDHPDPKADSPRWRISMALADTALLLLSVALAYGPVRVLSGRPPAVHLPWRRTIGVAAGMIAVIHLMVGLSVHGNIWRPWRSFVVARPSLDRPLPLLGGARGWANWLGLSAATILVCLVVISSNRWLRRLGAIRWKAAQRATYVAFVLVGAHAFHYWRVEQRLGWHRGVVLGLMAATVTLQVVAVVRLRTRARSGAA